MNDKDTFGMVVMTIVSLVGIGYFIPMLYNGDSLMVTFGFIVTVLIAVLDYCFIIKPLAKYLENTSE